MLDDPSAPALASTPQAVGLVSGSLFELLAVKLI